MNNEISEGRGNPPLKHCSRCDGDKPYSEFHKSKNKKDGYFTYCKLCKKDIAKKYYDENVIAVCERSKNWRSENPEKRKAQRERHYISRKNHILAKTARWQRDNPDKVRERNKRWADKNPEAAKIRDHRRRARKREALGIATADQVDARLAYYGYKCVYCGEDYEHIDHFFPLSKGGTNWPANLVPACSKCNLSKLAKNPWQFIKERLARATKV